MVGMEALVEALEEHGHLVVTVDDAATVGLPCELVERFEQANKSNHFRQSLADSPDAYE